MKKFFVLFFVFFTIFIFSSCDEEDTSVVKIYVQADKEFIIADGEEVINFTVTTEDGLDVTSDAVLKINGEILENNNFSTITIGAYYCNAEYKSAMNRVAFDAREMAAYKKNILIENYTAVWCGYCPRVHDAIINAINIDSRVIPIAIHGSDDPYYFSSIGTLAGKFNVAGYPTAIIDRQYSWEYPEVYSGLSQALNNNAALGLAISSEISGSNIIADVKIKFGKDFSESLNLVVCLVESNLIHDQVNYYDDGRGDPIVDYVHNNVLRQYGTDLYGELIPSSSTLKDAEYIKSVTFDCTDYIKENCEVIAFVTSDYEVLNSQSVEADGTKDYEPLDK